MCTNRKQSASAATVTLEMSAFLDRTLVGYVLGQAFCRGSLGSIGSIEGLLIFVFANRAKNVCPKGPIDMKF